MKRIVMDLDDTMSRTRNGDYSEALPIKPVIERLRELKSQGFEIVINTSRNMRTFEGNIGKINANTLPIIIEWLNYHDIPYDEIYTGKPWCGFEGFYVDDKSIRPAEFVSLSLEEIYVLLERDKITVLKEQ